MFYPYLFTDWMWLIIHKLSELQAPPITNKLTCDYV